MSSTGEPMSLEELEQLAGRKKPTDAERKIAARVVLRANRANGKTTPEWIRKLAEEKTYLPIKETSRVNGNFCLHYCRPPGA